jgi:hypothetical protein
MKDLVLSSFRNRANDRLCACSSRWKLSRSRKAILRTRIVCQLNWAGDPLHFGRTSTEISARRLVHSRSFSVESPVSCEATGVVTVRNRPSLRTGTIPDFAQKGVLYPISLQDNAAMSKSQRSFLVRKSSETDGLFQIRCGNPESHSANRVVNLIRKTFHFPRSSVHSAQPVQHTKPATGVSP